MIKIKKKKFSIFSKFQNKSKYIRANVTLAFRGIIVSNFGARFFNKDFIRRTFFKMIFGFLDGANQVLLVQFCVFVFIRSFVNDINYFRSIMFPMLYNKRDLKRTKHHNWKYRERRKTLFKEYIKVHYRVLTDLKKSNKKIEPNAFIFNLPNMKKNYMKAQKRKILLSPKYLKNYSEYKRVIGKITNRIMIFFGIESIKLRRSFEKLFYTTFSLMVYKKTLIERKKKWKKLTYRAMFLRRSFFRQRKVLKRIASRLTSSLAFYDK